MYIAILGRQPLLGLAELERIYGADKLTPLLSSNAALINCELTSSDLIRIGGSTKFAKVYSSIDHSEWRRLENNLLHTVPEMISHIHEGKIKIGLSVYGIQIKPETINFTTLKIKRAVQKTGRSVRVIPNKSEALNSAQVIHNKLIGSNGCEVVVLKHGHKTFIAQTIAEQNIDAYAARDQARPFRDAFVGMLPPKLAQIMINLASPQKNDIILDPFCGTGVILQEAALMEYRPYGTDLSEKMIEYSDGNLKWLQDKLVTQFNWQLEQADAMHANWKSPINAVVCETYLGQPFSAPPSSEKLNQVRDNCNHIISDFLLNIGGQLSTGTPLCIAVPAWRDKDGSITHLPLLKDLRSLGYRHLHLKYAADSDLIYFRPNQVVARQLLLLEKI